MKEDNIYKQPNVIEYDVNDGDSGSEDGSLACRRCDTDRRRGTAGPKPKSFVEVSPGVRSHALLTRGRTSHHKSIVELSAGPKRENDQEAEKDKSLNQSF